jgi:hypothetical protein
MKNPVAHLLSLHEYASTGMPLALTEWGNVILMPFMPAHFDASEADRIDGDSK